MTPGRELDALVAKHVMNWDFVDGEWHAQNEIGLTDVMPHVPSYSTDIAAAWEVVEKSELLSGAYLRFESLVSQWQIGYICDGSFEMETWGATVPHAICLAALKAVEMKVD